MTDAQKARRWRLILGRYANDSLPGSGLQGADVAIERTLSYLYDREYTARGHRLRTEGAGGSLDASALTALNWLGGARELFPQSTYERMQVHAIEKYGLTELLADEDAAAALVPSPQLATALLSIRGRLDASVEAGVRRVIAATVDDIVQRVRPRFAQALIGRRTRARSMRRSSATFDWRATLHLNLRNYNPATARLYVDQVRFTARAKRTLPWDVIVCVDQSGSMASSVMYSAVCASILAALPGVTVKLVLFDTSVTDVTTLASDPVGVLLTAQLGGGTDIAGALGYCEGLVTTPSRTVLTLISDFEEGGSVAAMLATVSRLRESGVTLLGLAALDEVAEPTYDRQMADRLSTRGMEIAALTPEHFGEWLGEVMA
ncbi:VWA domain-containing protein [Frondihabitans sp. Leaf304]|uniref:VWA domain-containing protein n=1 Tax=Frondihabitans sp. Leaf304 TaxID=1736329 RepID=UPI0006FFC4A7|nr:VWA domain-containing protein [Frondihabitans sp. Leaf304]KQQ27278.1 VWA containing CoxE family protein [Frondihabitans sp. Leaf304]